MTSTGTVADAQGNRIPNAIVKAMQPATGLERQTHTSSQGSYELPDLPPGLFIIQISKNGFGTFQADRVEQVVGQTRTLNATLSVSGRGEQTTIIEPLVQRTG